MRKMRKDLRKFFHKDSKKLAPMFKINNLKFFPCLILIGLSLVSHDGICVKSFSKFRLQIMAWPQIENPCLASLIGPPVSGCIEWQGNVDASPTYDSSRRFIFVGAADNFFHVLDADNGRPISQISTAGRVTTDAKFGDDRSLLYIGTDKGMVYGLDAFSFVRIFSFAADSQVNNNLTLVGDALVFTSGMGTIYSINSRNGLLNWQIEQPLAAERLRLSENSNIWYEGSVKNPDDILLVVPHADGYLSLIRAKVGQVEKKITLGTARANSFPDIVAPLIWFNNMLWVASYDLGVFSIDIANWQIGRHMDLTKIVQLASDGKVLFAASTQTLYAISSASEIKWQNNFSEIMSKTPPLGFPFNRVQLGAKHMFFGSPSRLLLNESDIIMATSSGSVGIFAKATGQVREIVANSVGLGPKINWAEDASFMAVSRRGLLMKF
jgi:hypothetical protein